TITLEMSPPGALSNAELLGSDGGTELFRLTESTGLMTTGETLSFLMPDIPVGTEVTLRAAADLQLQIDRCDAPRGCQSTYQVSDNVVVTVAP
ncbi:MAG: hypothetical protein AB7L28_28670, partial [Kofleriaceae bacterium]